MQVKIPMFIETGRKDHSRAMIACCVEMQIEQHMSGVDEPGVARTHGECSLWD
jgi:hypothetical protein